MDRFRIRGPERSVPPYFGPSLEANTEKRSDYTRTDGRSNNSPRQVYIRTGLIPQAKGSAYFESGKTKLVCAVYGPRQIKKQIFLAKGNLYCDFKFATFSCDQRRAHLKDGSEKEMSQMMEQALSPAICLARYPKSTIEVFVTVIENDGTMSCLAGAITAASVALVNAGIEMVDIVTASSAVYIKGSLFIDATQEEENIALKSSSSSIAGESSMLVALMPSLNLVTHLVQTNSIPSDVALAQQGIQACTSACIQLHSAVNQVLLSTVDTNEIESLHTTESRKLKIEDDAMC